MGSGLWFFFVCAILIVIVIVCVCFLLHNSTNIQTFTECVYVILFFLFMLHLVLFGCCCWVCVFLRFFSFVRVFYKHWHKHTNMQSNWKRFIRLLIRAKDGVVLCFACECCFFLIFFFFVSMLYFICACVVWEHDELLHQICAHTHIRRPYKNAHTVRLAKMLFGTGFI